MRIKRSIAVKSCSTSAPTPAPIDAPSSSQLSLLPVRRRYPPAHGGPGRPWQVTDYIQHGEIRLCTEHLHDDVQIYQNSSDTRPEHIPARLAVPAGATLTHNVRQKQQPVCTRGRGGDLLVLHVISAAAGLLRDALQIAAQRFFMSLNEFPATYIVPLREYLPRIMCAHLYVRSCGSKMVASPVKTTYDDDPSKIVERVVASDAAHAHRRTYAVAANHDGRA